MKFRWGLPLALLTVLLISGCGSQTPPGDTITIQAPPNDAVTWAAVPTNTACCPTPQCASGGLANVASGPVGPDGLVTVGTFTHQEDDTAYTITSTLNSPTPCLGVSNVIACATVFTLACNPQPTNAAAGQMTVSGQGDAVCYHSRTDIQSGPCSGSDGKTIYNSGTVSVTFDGQTVNARYGQTSTPVGLASQLAMALDQNSVLGSQFISAANGPVGLVHALNVGTQYDYSWTSSCSYNTIYFHWCSFTVGLSPAGSPTSTQ